MLNVLVSSLIGYGASLAVAIPSDMPWYLQLAVGLGIAVGSLLVSTLYRVAVVACVRKGWISKQYAKVLIKDLDDLLDDGKANGSAKDDPDVNKEIDDTPVDKSEPKK